MLGLKLIYFSIRGPWRLGFIYCSEESCVCVYIYTYLYISWKQYQRGIQNRFTTLSCEIALIWMSLDLMIISQHWFRWWLGAVRQRAITWVNVDPDLCRHMASLGPNELNSQETLQIPPHVRAVECLLWGFWRKLAGWFQHCTVTSPFRRTYISLSSSWTFCKCYDCFVWPQIIVITWYATIIEENTFKVCLDFIAEKNNMKQI